MFSGNSIGQPEERPSTAIATTSARPKPHTSSKHCVFLGWRRLMFLALAAVFFGLGLLGVLLPGIPATPFLLLTSYFLVRSSPRLNARLLRSRVFGPILVDWQVHGGVQMHVRYKAIAAVVIAVTASISIFGYSRFATLTVASLATIGVIVILTLPTARNP